MSSKMSEDWEEVEFEHLSDFEQMFKLNSY